MRGRIVLVPPEPTFVRLRTDFAAMVGSGMFLGDEPRFDEIIDRIEGLQNQINTAMNVPSTD